MDKIFTNKKLEISICTFASFIIVLGVIGSYFVLFQLGNLQKDFSIMKLITYIPMFLVSVYAFIYSLKNNESGIKSALFGVAFISLFVIIESFFGALTTDINGRIIFEFLSEAVKAVFVFMLMDRIVARKAMVCRAWYLILSFVFLFLPSAALGLYWIEATRDVVMESYILLLYILHGSVFVYALAAIITGVILGRKGFFKPEDKILVWSNFIYALSLLMYSAFSILINMVFQNSAWKHTVDATLLLTDISLLMIMLASVKKYNIPSMSGAKKRKK